MVKHNYISLYCVCLLLVVFDYTYYYTKLLTIVLNTAGMTHIRIAVTCFDLNGPSSGSYAKICVDEKH